MRKPVTPRGFRDVLPQEALERAALSDAMSRVMASWGYAPVETPAVEEYETLAETTGTSIDGRVFRMFDSDGRLLSLRPEMTVPIARMAATRLDLSGAPARLRYVADVFREETSLRGRSRQFTQVGLELIGEAGPTADAEVVCVLVGSLQAAGLREFVVGVGTVAVWQALIERAGMGPEWSADLLAAAHERNVAGIDALAAADQVPTAVAEALRAVPRIRGADDALERCAEVLEPCGVADVLGDLTLTWELLEKGGASERVTLDFGVMRSFDYYTGIVLEVYAPGIGLPLGGGGRYDEVLAKFGAPAPAAGFAVGLERLHIALSEQGVDAGMHAAAEVVLGGGAAEVFESGATLRAEGREVVLAPGRDPASTVDLATSLGAREALFAGPDGVVELELRVAKEKR